MIEKIILEILDSKLIAFIIFLDKMKAKKSKKEENKIISELLFNKKDFDKLESNNYYIQSLISYYRRLYFIYMRKNTIYIFNYY